MPRCAAASVRCMSMYYSSSDSAAKSAALLVALFGLHEVLPLKEKAIEKRGKMQPWIGGACEGEEGGVIFPSSDSFTRERTSGDQPHLNIAFFNINI